MKQDDRIYAEVLLANLSRYLATKQVRDQWRAMGMNPNRRDPVEFQAETNKYLKENKVRLREEARIILNKVP